MLKPARSELPALLALLAGALAIGSSGLFVRWSETGPVATAFWRGSLALPPLALWAFLERRAAVRRAAPARPAPLLEPLFFWAGAFFAGDIALWHLSLVRNSVGISTLEANTAPLLVSILAWAVFGERPRLPFLLALLLAFAGMLLIVGPKVAAGSHALAGDALALGAAWFYAAYLLAVARLRTRHGTAVVMFMSTLIFSALLLPFALTERFLPLTAQGWLVVLGCALSAQALGQSLIAYGLAHLPATLGAVALYLQVVASAIYAWLLLGERLAPWQLAGGVVVLIGIALARASRQSRTTGASVAR